MAASEYRVTSKEIENQIFRDFEFLETHAFTNNPYWQKSGIIIFLCKYDIVISDTLVDFFLELALFVAMILSQLYEKPRRNKDWVAEESTWKNLREGHHFFDCTPYFLCHFFCLLRLLPFPSDALIEWPQ